MAKHSRRVVITGMGVVSPLGCNLDVFWRKLTAGVSGIRRVTRFDVTEYSAKIAGEVADFDPDAFLSKKQQHRMDPYGHYAVAATKMATADSGIDFAAENPCRMGVIVGSGVGGLQTMQKQYTIIKEKGPTRCSPFTITQIINNMVSGLVAIEYKMKGPNFSVVSACATSCHAIGQSARIIQNDEADIMISGGSDACICELGFAGFCSMRALSVRNDEPERASRPFDRDRDGFVMAEGAAAVVLEDLEHARKRGARIYCEVSGYGATCDAFHETAPDEDGDGAARAMALAMREAELNPGDIDYINAHGTSTQLNDKCETFAIKRAFGEHARKVMISSSKSMTGHLLGAAGGIESVICALAITHNVVPPTINYENPDPDCDLDYVPNTARETKVDAAANNSMGFGGHNASLIFTRV